jgi:hypothetical protein
MLAAIVAVARKEVLKKLFNSVWQILAKHLLNVQPTICVRSKKLFYTQFGASSQEGT